MSSRLRIAALRAEIERDGVPVRVSDDQLLLAVVEPGIRALQDLTRAHRPMIDVVASAAEAFGSLVDALERVEAMDHLRWEIDQLPHTDLDDDR